MILLLKHLFFEFISRSGRVSVESALNLTLYLSQELDYIPWYTFYDVMLLFDRLLAGSTVYGDLRVSR